MKKVFFIPLLLVSIFLIGNAELALAQCSDYQDYECTYTVYRYGQIDGIDFDCIELCFDDGFEVYATDYDFFEGWLYPATGSKNLLGTANTMAGWAGFSMDFKGRSMIYRFSFIQNDDGYTETAKCTPCDDCCSSVSDRRLKKFIKEVKGIYNQIGLKMYRWQWTKKAERMFGLKGYSAGVIAQEVKEKYPDAVVEYKGYLKVRYDYLDRLLLMQ